MGLTIDGPVQTRLYQQPALMQIQRDAGRQVELLPLLPLWFQEGLKIEKTDPSAKQRRRIVGTMIDTGPNRDVAGLPGENDL